jgi:hypothetical protein
VHRAGRVTPKEGPLEVSTHDSRDSGSAIHSIVRTPRSRETDGRRIHQPEIGAERSGCSPRFSIVESLSDLCK